MIGPNHTTPDDHIPPPDSVKLRCRCRYVGLMNVRQTEYGNGHDTEDRWEATCPKCSLVQDLYGDEKPCDHCGVLDQPELLMDIDGDMLCLRCRLDEWDHNIDRIAKRLEVAS